MRRAQPFATVALTVLLAILPGPARAQPTVFFPGQAFCPSRTLVLGTVTVSPQQCFSLFVMRTQRAAFLGLVPAGLFGVPLGQNIGLATSLGASIMARAMLVLPTAFPFSFVPVDTIHLEPFQVEEMVGWMGVRLAGDPDVLIPIASPPGSYGTAAEVAAGSSGVPVPGDLLIHPPGPEIPRDEAIFSGRWSGRWKDAGESIVNDGPTHFLAVESIIRDDRFLQGERRVVAVFAWGRSGRSDVLPGWLRAEGVFQRGILFLTLASGAHASYRMGIDGTLVATYEGPLGAMRGVLSRLR
jgi:hypothetical protein